MRLSVFFILVVFCIGLMGCGYTGASLLPEDLKTIHVENFENKIDPTREVSNRRASHSYQPGLEVSITRAVIDEFIFDRNLEIDRESKADLLLSGELVDYSLCPLSYDGDDNVEEFRVEVFVNLELYNNLTGKVMWKEKRFMGQNTYSITGPNSKTESQAVKGAVKDLAQRIVERTVEAW